MDKNSILQKAGLVLISVLLSVFILELLLRVVYPAQAHYFVWQPGLQHHFYPDTLEEPFTAVTATALITASKMAITAITNNLIL